MSTVSRRYLGYGAWLSHGIGIICDNFTSCGARLDALLFRLRCSAFTDESWQDCALVAITRDRGLNMKLQGSEFGYEFERHVRRAFMGSMKKLTCYSMADIVKSAANKSKELDQSLLSFGSTFSIRRFDEEGDLKNVTGRQMLYIPRSSIHKAWDFIIHTPPACPGEFHQVVFVQVSKDAMRTHDAIPGGGFLMKNSVTEPMDPKKGMSTKQLTQLA